MVKSLLAWAVSGIFGFGWYWIGYGWSYIQNVSSGSWDYTWLFFTILVIIVHRRNGVGPIGAHVVETVVNRITAIIPHVLGLAISLMVGLTLYSLNIGGFDVNSYIQAIVIVLSNAFLVSAVLGAVDDATQ
ncbi:MAG: hypothetical protein HOJ34_03035 [Kordiimonadaceae bacterium]|jgi:hypothetical protein|nr:hypothetical protein [Kordiimonadaceae bacterium]MBT6036352.1 hypothetical protein [Kordiimonadaceae bacterium]MBT6328734.1 hypothetical protein [Kordiimonadaceae bacterium]MBT7581598.1 hypothetical protein [Kordiimonadaceae bacterium]